MAGVAVQFDESHGEAMRDPVVEEALVVGAGKDDREEHGLDQDGLTVGVAAHLVDEARTRAKFGIVQAQGDLSVDVEDGVDDRGVLVEEPHRDLDAADGVTVAGEGPLLLADRLQAVHRLEHRGVGLLYGGAGLGQRLAEVRHPLVGGVV